MTRAFVGLGANLGDRQRALEHALSLLMRPAGIQVLRLSSLYETEPEDVRGGWFLNGVAEVETRLPPRQLLDALLQVEEACGRPRFRERGEARVVDVDLLLYGSHVIADPNLHVPHPRMHLRRFVLVPLAELDPGLVHPGLKIRIVDLLGGLPPGADVRLVAPEWFAIRAEEGRVR